MVHVMSAWCLTLMGVTDDPTSLTSSGSLMSTMGYRPKNSLQIGPYCLAISGSATCMPAFICRQPSLAHKEFVQVSTEWRLLSGA